MTNVHRTARLERAPVGREHGQQGLLKLLGRHLVALDLQLLLRVALIIDVVGRVGEHQVGLLPSHQALDRIHRGRISAEQPMVAQNPQISRLSHGELLNRRRFVLVG